MAEPIVDHADQQPTMESCGACHPASTARLAAALARFQAELPAVKKTKTATVPTKSGGQYRYSYAGLAEVAAVVMPLLGKYGLSFTARPTLEDGGRFVLAYSLLHESGERLDGMYPLPQSGSPQEYGSAITYARRYSLCSVVGVAAEDDDDGAAVSDHRHHVAEQHWDPHEQEMLYDGWLAEIDAAATSADIDAIGRKVLAQRNNRKLSPITFDKLSRRAGERRAELAALERPAGEAP